jgi:hypothetical protein
MRRQKAIVAASGPRTPINGPASSRIGVLRNGGDSGIFTAAGRLCPLRPLEGEAVEAGKNQKNSSGPSGRGHRHSSRQRLRHAFFPPKAAPARLHNTRSPVRHRRLRLACGESHRRRPCRTRPPPAGRTSGQVLWDPPRITRCRLSPLYPKPRTAAMAQEAPRQGAIPA